MWIQLCKRIYNPSVVAGDESNAFHVDEECN